MIQSAHILTGAAIASIAPNPWVAVPAALASHYILDLVPHKEYAIEHLHMLAAEGKYGWAMLFDLGKGLLDVFFGIMVVILLTNGATWPLIVAFVAVIPDLFHPVDIAFARRHGLPYPQFHENPYDQIRKNILTRFLSWQRGFHFKMHLLEREFVPRWMGLLTQISAIFAGGSVLFLFGGIG